MGGIAQYHFPRLVWKNGERRLWNPIQKKALKIRPEERVRLRIIDALAEMGWSKSRISTEEPIRPSSEPGGRTDIICYDRDFSPKLLVECKAEHVPISPRVAEQTARYNRSVQAEYLLMSNGITDFWYHFPGPREDQAAAGDPRFSETSGVAARTSGILLGGAGLRGGEDRFKSHHPAAADPEAVLV